VLSSIPILSALNCCFCLLNMAGAAIGLSLYFKERPNEKISNGDAAGSGAISGAVAGLISGIVGLVKSLLMNPGAFRELERQLPPDLRPMAKTLLMGGGAIGLIVGPLIYAAFGALGGYLAMQVMFKEKRLNG
jgi:hypothetical protein